MSQAVEAVRRPGRGGARPGAGRPRKPPPEPVRPVNRFRWYVVRTAHNQTALADREIREAGFAVFAPTVFRAATPPRRDSTGVMRPGKPDRVDYLFVRYIITRLNLADPAWHNVRRLPSVERIISGSHSTNGGAGVPIALPDYAVDWIRGLPGMSETGCIYPASFPHTPLTAGTVLRVLEGPMTDLTGICKWTDGRRVMLLINLLGRSVPVTIARSGVKTA